MGIRDFTESELRYITVESEKLLKTLPAAGAKSRYLAASSPAWRELISDLSLPANDPRRVDAENILEFAGLKCLYRAEGMFFMRC